MLADLSPQRRRFVIGCVAAPLVLALVAVIASRGGSSQASPGVPILLVHGYGGSVGSMKSLASGFKHRHRSVEAVALPQHGRADIFRSAEVLAHAVDDTGNNKVDLVGFSAGALVVRTYASSEAGREHVRRVVLLGAPNHGADLASLAIATDPSGCLDACQQLTPGSGFLRALNAKPLPPGISFTSIWSGNDRTVTPPNSAVLQGATNIKVQSVCARARLDHGDLVTDPISVALAIVSLGAHPDPLPSCKRLRVIGTDALNS